VNRINLSDPPAPDDFDPKSYSLEARRARTPPGQTLAKKFPHLEYASIPTVTDPRAWTLKISGEVASDPVFSLVDLVEQWPVAELHEDFHCITGWSMLDATWQGVSPRALVEAVQPHDSVTTVLIHGLDEFSTCVWLEDFLQGIVAYGYKGRPLAPQHGFPLRFVAPSHLWQYKSCKWVTGLEFLTEHRLGFWEIRAYSDSAKVWENDRYANPFAESKPPMGQLRKRFEKKP
jgi:DMSO/TMAO reductase YedYZ molybdopterin-dependent catalytic subunit